MFPQRWLRHYVGSKLRSDPVFPAIYAQLRDSSEPILDIGCGVGLLGFYLRERGFENPVTGIDADARKIREARKVASQRYGALDFIECDVRDPLPPFRGNVTVLDLLHYLEPPRQQTLLTQLGETVRPGGALLLRDCPRDGSARFWMTYCGERFAQTISWNIGARLHFPTSASINAAFGESEFAREEQAAWGRTPFNNRLFIYRRRSAADRDAE